MKLKQVGEFELVNKIIALAGKPSGIIAGLGEDAAVVYSRGERLVATTDSLVDGVHFISSCVSPEDIGYKALAINLSDIAAMGAKPSWSLLSLSLPPETEEEWVISLVKSFVESGKRYQTELIGGDVHSSPIINITATVLGNLDIQTPLLRSAALTGDLIATTGYLGASAGGLEVLKGKLYPQEKIRKYLIKAHLRPKPRLEEGRLLLEHGVKAAIDISDGLVSDLRKLCQASHVGAKIKKDRIPISPALSFLAHEQALNLSLYGGEDYELLFTAPPEIMERVASKLEIFIIGEIVEGEGEVWMVDETGGLSPIYGGWEHFRG